MFLNSTVALVTPMLADGCIDYAGLERLIDWHVEEGSDALLLLGTTGESATLRPEERTALIKHTVAYLKKRLPLMVGTGSNATWQSIAYTEEAKRLGADAVLLVTPYYNKPNQAGLTAHFAALAQAVAIPQYLYNVPSRTGCDLLPETALALAKAHSTIFGIKEASGDLSRLAALLEHDWTVLSGDDLSAAAFMRAGGHGVVSVAANVIPKAFHALCVASCSGDEADSKKRDAVCQPLYAALFSDVNPVPTKWALEAMGKIHAHVRLPLVPLAEPLHEPLRALLNANKLTLTL